MDFGFGDLIYWIFIQLVTTDTLDKSGYVIKRNLTDVITYSSTECN